MKSITGVVALLVICWLPALTGCAGPGSAEPSGNAEPGKDTAVARVIEWGADAGGLVTHGQVGGCSVHQSESKASADGKGSMSFFLVYQGKRCGATVQSKDQAPAPTLPAGEE